VAHILAATNIGVAQEFFAQAGQIRALQKNQVPCITPEPGAVPFRAAAPDGWVPGKGIASSRASARSRSDWVM